MTPSYYQKKHNMLAFAKKRKKKKNQLINKLCFTLFHEKRKRKEYVDEILVGETLAVWIVCSAKRTGVILKRNAATSCCSHYFFPEVIKTNNAMRPRNPELHFKRLSHAALPLTVTYIKIVA